MTFDPWTLGLQALNVLILMWLLSRVLWRPAARAIAARQAAAEALLDEAEAAKARAEAAEAKVAEARAGMQAERAALLEKAARTAERTAETAKAEAADKAATREDAARIAAERAAEAARAGIEADAAALAVDIARRLLARFDEGAVRARFLALLTTAVEEMPAEDRDALLAAPDGIAVISAAPLDKAARATVAQALESALGAAPVLSFEDDPALIAGFELRTPHFALRDSWRADLDAILADLRDAA
jgi:F-type H+-transporting ATPase subunit b